MLSEFEKRVLSSPKSWAYPAHKESYNLKGHYATFIVAQLPYLESAFADKNDSKYFEEKLDKLLKKDLEFVTLQDINDNKMEFYDRYYDAMDLFFMDIRMKLNIE